MVETRFKQTEIGLIPEDWEIIPLRDVAENYTGLTYSPNDVHSYGTLVLRSSNIQDSQLCFDDNVYVIMDVPQRAIVRNEDILVCVRNGSQQLIGKSAKITPEADGMAFGAFMTILRPKNIDGDFLLYVWRSRIIQKQIEEILGATINQITNADLKSFIVLCPSSREQQLIAEALSNIDQLISSLSKTIEKKRLIKQGAMQQLLTGKKRLPGFDKEWVEYRLEDVINRFATGLNPRQNFTLNSSGSNNYYVTIKNFREGQLYLDDNCDKINDYALELINHRSNLRSGDVLMSSIGRIGDAYVIVSEPKNWNINESVFSLRPDYSKITSLFLYYTIKSDLLQKQIKGGSTGSTLTSIKMSHLKELLCYIPTSMEEQSAITNILSTMDNEIESLKEEREKSIRLKEGMMQKLLSGQIRLINTEAKPIVQPKEKVANVYFRRSVLAAEIADRLCEERTFGHVKMEKLIFLTEHLCHVDIDSHYHRDAAGPYDNRALRSIDSQMKKQKWFEAKKEDKGYRYLPMQNRGGHKKYFEKYYADVMPMFEKIIDTFKTSSTEQCEIVATLYSAWDDLLQNHQPFTDDDILNEVLNNWNETKKRIKRSRWQAALDWMRANGFVPQNDNR